MSSGPDNMSPRPPQEKLPGPRMLPRPVFEEPDAGWQDRHRSGIILVLLALGSAALAAGIALAPEYLPWLNRPHRIFKVMVGVIAALAIVSRPFVSLAIMPLAFVYMNWLPKSPLPLLNAANILMASLIYGWVGKAAGARRGGIVERSEWNLPVLLFLVWLFFAWLRSALLAGGGLPGFLGMLGAFWRTTCGLILFFPIYNNIRTWKQIRLLTLFFCVGSALGVVGIYREALSMGWSRGVGGGIGQPNEAAAYFASATLFCMGMISAGHRGLWRRLAVLASLVGCGAALVIPASRGAYAGFLVGAMTQVARVGLLWVVLIGLLVGGFLLWAPDYVKDRTMRAEEAVTAEGDKLDALDAEGGGRLTFWRASLQVAAEHPLFGVGYGQISRYIGERTGSARPSHSLYMETVGEMGVPGLALLLWVFLSALFAAGPLLQHRGFPRALGLSFQSALLVLMVANVFGNRFYSISLSGMLAFLCALVMRARRLLELGVPDPENVEG